VNANVKAGRCKFECSKAWKGEHGSAVPGGPFPGTHGSEGDVRRCEHGRIWSYVGGDASYQFDHWERLRWWEFPMRYRRAVRALRAADA